MTNPIQMFHVVPRCRICEHDDLKEVISFGEMPLADGLRNHVSIEGEFRFPLTLAHCQNCSLVQIRENVDVQLLFGKDYPYYASFSKSWVEHCRLHANELIEARQLNRSSRVIEIACNDGYMLRHFLDRGIPVLGIDPAPGPVAAARQLGIEVVEEFLTAELAARLAPEPYRADVLIANNVLAHVQDLPDFVEAIRELLKPGGLAVFEVPYLGDLVARCEFDTIYHEHHCYFSLTSLVRLFESHGLSVNQVRRLSTHGGSIRVFVERLPDVKLAVRQMLDEEAEQGLTRFDFMAAFAEKVDQTVTKIQELIGDLKANGKRIAAYAAAAKGAMLVNACRIGNELDFVVDRNSHKQGRYLPGTELIVRSPEVLLDELPDYVLLLAWNLKQEILKQQSEYLERGGRFIIPIPHPVVI